MKIKKIRIKNFYSFKDVELDLENYSGLTLIEGINLDAEGSVGSGKSVLVEAIYFGLTGKTIRKSTEDTLVNNQAKKKLEVDISIDHDGHDVRIVRKKKPTFLQFWVDEEERTQQSVYTTQDNINAFLNINYKVLLSSMFFGQSNDLNFLDCNADDKRVIIKNFLNLDEIFSMRDKIKALKSDYYQGAKLKEAVIEEVDKNLASLEDKLSKIRQAKGTEFPEEYKDPALSIELLMKREREYKEKKNKKEEYEKLLKNTYDRIRNLQSSIENPIEIKQCPTCGQDTPGRTVADMKVELNQCNETFGAFSDLRNVLVEGMVLPTIQAQDFTTFLNYQALCKEEVNYTGLKEELLASKEEAQRIREDNKLQYEVMRFWEKAFSEQGVIKYIIKNVLDYFNEKCNYYLSYLTNAKYSVDFDEELNEKIETNNRLVSYISLSGGEKRKLNLAVTLALKDLLLLTDNTHVSVLFFDEITENIDDQGVFGLYQLLLEIKKTKNVFIITHNKYLNTLLDSVNRITITKHKGISRITKEKYANSKA